ncbi:MAG: choice-of-anchor B family protein [Longimicrobiales bacterium]
MTAATVLLMLASALPQERPTPARVQIEPERLGLEVGQTRALEVVVYDSSGAVVQEPSVIYFSQDPSVASIDGAGAVTALQPGSVRVGAIAGDVSETIEVLIAELPPAAIDARLPAAALPAGTSAAIGIVIRDREGTPLAHHPVRFASADTTIAAVDDAGRVFARAPGATRIDVTSGTVGATVAVEVQPNPARTYTIEPDRVGARTGDVVRIRVRAQDANGGDVAPLYPAWSVDASGAQVDAEDGVGVFVAEQPGTYRVSAQIGEDLVRTAVIEATPREPQGRLERVGHGMNSNHHHFGDTWAFEGVDGRDYAYIGTYLYDWMKVWDITDPANPQLTDSLQLDARRINDVKIHPNNRLAILTREQASSRRNGIVILDLATPAHPRILSEYTETVTGGVHNVWIDGETDLVYACHNGTSELHVIDIGDPRNPREVGRWGLDKENKVLHDVIVQDGYAYVSYWDDGLIILDVGAGTHGGTPTTPAFVSQFKYPQGNTHVAWRAGRYVFVGDEIFPPDWDPDRPIETRGYIHVLDVSDIDRPREVAKYEVPEAGTHNVWVEDDRLYVGYYQAGLRVVDISGELRGDLYRQGREIAVFKTYHPEAVTPNWSMTWGAQVFKGNIVSSDLNSGLWVTRLETGEVVF